MKKKNVNVKKSGDQKSWNIEMLQFKNPASSIINTWKVESASVNVNVLTVYQTIDVNDLT